MQTFNFTYDSLGRRTSLSMPNNTITNYQYNQLNQITQIQTQNSNNQIINSNIYTYDAVGNKLTKQDPSGTHNYTYDNTYQLINATHPTIPQETFTYDQVGNRTNTTVDAANKLLQDPNATYQYDANGNRYVKTQADGTIVYYSYDYEGRLTRVETQKPNLTTIAVYKYDPLGRRIEKAVTENSMTTTTRYLYDGFNIIAEYDGSASGGGNLITKYIHGLGIDEPLSITKNSQIYYYHADGLGSIVALTDNAGNVAQTYKYDSFGNITNQTGTINQPYTFTGREYDPESGTYHYRERSYDQKTGTFTTKDPIGFKGKDVNLYRYVWNDPVNWIDPLGLFGDGGPKAKYPGHSDFTGHDIFDYTLEDKGTTQPYPIIGKPERHFRDLSVSVHDVAHAINSCNKEAFERAMHRGQDYFSHYSKGYRWKPGDKSLPCRGLGHGCDSTKPDEDQAAWNKAEAWTKPLVKKWNEKCGCKR